MTEVGFTLSIRQRQKTTNSPVWVYIVERLVHHYFDNSTISPRNITGFDRKTFRPFPHCKMVNVSSLCPTGCRETWKHIKLMHLSREVFCMQGFLFILRINRFRFIPGPLLMFTKKMSKSPIDKCIPRMQKFFNPTVLG